MPTAKASIVLCLLLGSALAGTAVAQVTNVTGTVVDKQGRRIPGLSVYLLYPEGKREGPKITDDFGRFNIANVPRRKEAYYVEIYWGKQLYARKVVMVDRDGINVGNIVL